MLADIEGKPALLESAVLDVRGATIQYKTGNALVTATYRVDFSVLGRTGLCCWGHRAAVNPRCSKRLAAISGRSKAKSGWLAGP
jgi:hypothetical protein